MRFYAERDGGPLAVSFFERVLQLFRAAAREREYIAEDGTSYPLQAGSLVQRLPGVPHSTRVDPDGKWLEFLSRLGNRF